jgi:hypothetical protein
MHTTPLAAAPVIRSVRSAILRTLLYFDVFQYPLTEEEISRFNPLPGLSAKEVEAELEELVCEGIVLQHMGHYGFGALAANLEKRVADNARARSRMAKAHRIGRFIGRFPFVRAVMLSGSISKGCLAKDGDIDYFVITEPGRLWIARTLLIGFKKLFLFNSRKAFCVNYFVDLDHLEIEDRNLFTATEILTLLPVCGADACAAFFRANRWANTFLPDLPPPATRHVPAIHGPVKRLFERCMRNGMGDEVDEWCMLRTLRHWKNKFAEFDRQRFELALRTRKYVSKHHPRNFQQRVLDAYAERLQRIGQAEIEHA